MSDPREEKALHIVPDITSDIDWNTGMTLRDYFAAKAMQSFMEFGWNDDKKWFKEVAECAYRQADEMLKAREEK